MIYLFTNYEGGTLNWAKIIESDLNFKAAFKVLPTKGKIAWEYNPLHNLRLDLDMFEYNGRLYSQDQINRLVPTIKDATTTLPEDIMIYQKGELVDFITDLLNFSLRNPVNITPSYSYDGTVDLVLNDGKNLPRLINTRFSTTGMNTYEVVNRKGDNDTNIYDMGELFDIDSSLYKKTNKIPKVIFNGTPSGGDLKIGNYHFYFKYADADGNETDFIAESGLVSVFKGFSSPMSINTGQKNENSFKCASFTITNVDSGYPYLHVYYTRYTAELNQNMVTSAFKIELQFAIKNNSSNIIITGTEESTEIPISDINLQYNVINSAKSLAVCQNMLFLANVQKAEEPYEELQDLSLRFLPYLHTKDYDVTIDKSYNIETISKGYFDSKFIYDFTGYWDLDLYRLGIVYILKDNTLSHVYNIRGREKVKTFEEYNRHEGDFVNSQAYTTFDVRNKEGEKERIYINYDELTHLIVKTSESTSGGFIGNASYENVKGVVSLDSAQDTDKILGFDIRTDKETIEELKQYVKGFFFVRQRRLPLTLCLGITIGIEKNSRLPAIPTVLGITDINYENTYAESVDGNPEEIHYVLEGFLSRFHYKLVPKDHKDIWKKVGLAIGIAAIIAAGIIGSVFSGGMAGVAATGAIAAILGSVSTTAVAVGCGIGVAAVAATAIVAGSITSSVLGIQLARNHKGAAEPKYGRKAKIPAGYKREELEDSRMLDADFKDRIIIVDLKDCETGAMLIPEYTVHPGKYNLLFDGDEFVVEYTKSQSITNYTNCGYFVNDIDGNPRHFYIPEYKDWNNHQYNSVLLLGVSDGLSSAGMLETMFKAKAGDPNLANKFLQTRTTYKDSTLNDHSDLIRGLYGPYVAMLNFRGPAATTLNVKIPGFSEGKLKNYIDMRAADHSQYSAISDRFDIFEIFNKNQGLLRDSADHFETVCYRGDCYLCLFTLRLNRNLNDPNAPYNETFVDAESWKEHFNVDKKDEITKVNVGDVNAVELGMWITFKVRSTYNLNIRTIDDSYIEEVLESGHARGYYPYHPMSTDGSYKIPESLTYNLGFSKSLSEQYHFEVPDVPYIKNWFGTRVMYSDINITDGYKNGFRSFRGTAYLDYTREYGVITKIVELNGNLIVVFEHGIGFLEVNEKAVAAQSQSGNVYITTNNVLPEKVTVLSDALGSQWADSVLKVPVSLGDTSSVIFGVDTVAKKIWMCDGRNVSCISDFKVLEFLNNNITLGERDLIPTIGVRNVKTLYNAYKQDVMFTFYDCLSGFEDKVWNLCYNLTLKKFITFYSWVPTFMDNIDNIPFSFDRDVSKAIGKLGTSKMNNDFSDGIVLSNNIIPSLMNSYTVGKLGLANRVLPTLGTNLHQFRVDFEVVRDNYRNDKLFEAKLGIDPDHPEDWYLVLTPDPSLRKTYNDANNDGIVDTSIQGREHSLLASLGNLPQSSNTVNILGIAPADRFKFNVLNSELYYRNIEDNCYADWEEHSNIPENCTLPEYAWRHRKAGETLQEYKEAMEELLAHSISKNFPIFKDRSGRKIMLPEEDRINLELLVRMINIRANIYIENTDNKLSESMYNAYKAERGDNSGQIVESDSTSWISCGYYESSVAVITEWNLLFLTSDFWKHGQAGLIDIHDDVKPTVWYGKLHPFEFECVVVDEPAIHKIFQNLELVANKAKPESFHFEIIGETYDFAKDKPNMYFRLEARKALFQYNGCDITYNKNFLKVQPRLQPRSAELVYNYFERLDSLQLVQDNYLLKNGAKILNDTYTYWANMSPNKDYRHLSGAEVVYYPTRLEYRIWQHLPAIDIDSLPLDKASSVIRGNCHYLEDRWKISINPLLICYKNEYRRMPGVNGSLCQPINSTWAYAQNSSYSGRSNTLLPPITIRNTNLPISVQEYLKSKNGYLQFPDESKREGKDNALYGLYYWPSEQESNIPIPIDNTNWLSDLSVYKMSFGEALNRKEADIRDRFLKVRIRYSGEELAVIDFLNTIYSVSYA